MEESGADELPLGGFLDCLLTLPHPSLSLSVPGASKDEGPPQKEGEGRANFIHRTAGHSLGANFFYPFCWETETGLKVSEKQDLK